MRVRFAIPGDIETPTGGYAYARAIIPCLVDEGISVEHVALPGGFPFPSGAELAQTAEILGGGEGVVMIDGLAYGAMPEAVISAARGPIVALTHHPLALETGLSEAQLRALHESERAALALAAHVIVTSQTTAETLIADYGVERARLTVAEPGVAVAERSVGGGDIPHLLAVGTLSPRKGYDVLVSALARVSHLPWRCTIAGATDRDSSETARVMAAVRGAGLASRIAFTGALSDAELEALYAQADIFVLASHYEGYGMAFASAMARGLPIVACAGGATAQTVPTEAGILVPPGDAAAFALALRAMLSDDALRMRYADGSWAHASRLPRWSGSAAKIAAVIREVSK